MLLSDEQIMKLVINEKMIDPFVAQLVREVSTADDLAQGCRDDFCPAPSRRKVVSYGLSSYGYDLRLSGKEFFIFRRKPGQVISPKKFNINEHLEPQPLSEDETGEFYIIPAHSYGLGVIHERLVMPPNVTGVCVGKSTYARMGLIVNITPAEAGWEGHLTVEMSNSSDSDIQVYAGEGICQMLFFAGEQCRYTYATRPGGPGKYQGQGHEVVIPRI